MKRLLLLSSLLILSPLTFVHAQESNNEINDQIEQLQSEVLERQKQILELKQSQLGDGDIVEFEHDDLKVQVQVEVTPYEGDQDYFEDTYIILHVAVENLSDDAVKFDPDGFNMYLADVQQGGVDVIFESMELQAVPGKTIVEGKVYFNVTKSVSNDKDLIVKYQPSEDFMIGDTVFEFKVNDYKHINSDDNESDEEAQAPTDEVVAEVPVEETNETTSDEPYFYEVDGVTFVRHNGYDGPYNPQGEPAEPYTGYDPHDSNPDEYPVIEYGVSDDGTPYMTEQSDSSHFTKTYNYDVEPNKDTSVYDYVTGNND